MPRGHFGIFRLEPPSSLSLLIYTSRFSVDYILFCVNMNIF